MTTTENDKFQRWQTITIDQLGYTLNLILTFTIAALGYWFVLLKDRDFTPASSARCTMIFSLLALTFSAICGMFCAVNRLWDFRGTAQRAHANTEAPSREYLTGLGQRTWVVLYCQLCAFVLGVMLLGISLLLTYGGKLV